MNLFYEEFSLQSHDKIKKGSILVCMKKSAPTYKLGRLLYIILQRMVIMPFDVRV